MIAILIGERVKTFLKIVLFSFFIIINSEASGLAVIDGHKIESKDELHIKLGKDLGFSQSYAANLDALYETLIQEKETKLIKIINFHSLQAKIGKKYIEGFLKAISDASDENQKIVLIISSK